MTIGTVQIGKNGVSGSFFNSLENMFKNHKLIKVPVLRSARGEGKEAKQKVREFSETILNHLGNKYTAKIIGFTIILQKWRKPQR